MEEPADRLTIQYNNEPKELFLSYLRLNSCLRVIGDAKNIPMLMVDPDISENILRVVLAPKGGPGAMFDFELEETALSAEDADRILLWVQDHLTRFFMTRFQQAQASAEKLEPMIKVLESQGSGSGASSSTTASAGPSA